MNALPFRRPRSDSTLKRLPIEKQEAIADYGAEHSVTETRDFVVNELKIKTSRTAVGNFLGWATTLDQRCRNKGAVHAITVPIESDGPDLTPEELQARAKQHFSETIIEQSDISAFNQSERIALRREELEIQRQELELKRKIYERDTAQWVVKVFTSGRLKSIAQDTTKTYADRIDEVQTVMFGEEEELDGVEPLNGGTVESAENKTAEEKGRKGDEGKGKSEGRGPKSESNSNIQHSTSNIQHPKSGAEAPASKLQAPKNNQTANIQTQTFNIQHSTLNVQAAENLHPATSRPALETAGSLGDEAAARVIDKLYVQSVEKGYGRLKANEVAALRAYLTGKPQSWFNFLKQRKETVQPPAYDPRLNPASKWCRIWKQLEGK